MTVKLWWLVGEGMFRGAFEVCLDIAGDGEVGVFERVVIEEVVQLGAVVFVVGVLGFNGVGIDGDGGSIGE